jgi:hypothetical protein
MENKSILQWCKDLHEAGNELVMKWEGGGDSGWVYFEIDGESADNEYTRALVDRMDNTLDYGSWAGEFSASGSATYDPETNSFTGIDFYGEDDGDVMDAAFHIHVPKKLWFDTLHVEVECNYDEGAQMSVRLLLKNGFLTNEHKEFCSNLENTLEPEFNSLFESYGSKNGYQFRGCTDSWVLERSEAIERDDMLVFKITKVDIQINTNEERNVVLELDEETVNEIDEQLNDVEDESN